MMKYNYFIGIDVSKQTLDVAILNLEEEVTHYQIENNTESILSFFSEKLKTVDIKSCLFVAFPFW